MNNAAVQKTHQGEVSTVTIEKWPDQRQHHAQGGGDQITTMKKQDGNFVMGGVLSE